MLISQVLFIGSAVVEGVVSYLDYSSTDAVLATPGGHELNPVMALAQSVLGKLWWLAEFVLWALSVGILYGALGMSAAASVILLAIALLHYILGPAHNKSVLSDMTAPKK